MESQTQLRNRAFISDAMSILGTAMAKGEHLTRRQLIERTLSRRPPYFYVNFEHAVHIVGAILSERAGKPRSAKSRMWYDLAAQVLQVQRRQPHMTTVQALSYVLCYRRPTCYHMSYNTARHILAAAIQTKPYVEPLQTAKQ